jgi:hypothetical protein
MASCAIPDLKALFRVQIVLLRIWKTISYILDGDGQWEYFVGKEKHDPFLWRLAWEGEIEYCNLSNNVSPFLLGIIKGIVSRAL